MYLVGTHFRIQRGVDALVPLDAALAFEFSRNDDGRPVATVALHLDVLAGQAGADESLKFVGGHGRCSGAAAEVKVGKIVYPRILYPMRNKCTAIALTTSRAEPTMPRLSQGDTSLTPKNP